MVIDWNVVYTAGLFFALGGGYFLKSYLSEKGKNLATKQDIKSITNEIEDVKVQYTESMEKLKSYIQIGVGNQYMVQEKTNEILIKFFEDCMLLHDEKLTINLGDFPMDNGESLTEYWNSTGTQFLKVFSDYYKLLIYLEEDNSIVKVAKTIFEDIQQIYKIFKDDFFYLKLHMVSMNEAGIAGDEEVFYKLAAENKERYEKYVGKIGSLNESVKSNLETYVLILNEYLKSICYESKIKDLNDTL